MQPLERVPKKVPYVERSNPVARFTALERDCVYHEIIVRFPGLITCPHNVCCYILAGCVKYINVYFWPMVDQLNIVVLYRKPSRSPYL